MKIKLLLIILNLNCLIAVAQTIYSDEFNEGINNTSSSSSLTSSISNNNLRIVGNGSAGPWDNTIYSFHNSGNNINVNATSNPKLYIKVKADNPLQMRIDLIDVNGYVTNATPSSISLNSNYQIFEINYTGKLKDAGYAGPCSPGPCVVNAAQLKGLMFFFNAGAGAYNGTIDIEWLSIGQSLETIPDYEIRYNQVGYFSDRNKTINIVSPNSFLPKSFTILNSTGNTVLSGTTTASSYWSSSNEYVAKADISAINTSGTYKFKTDELDITFNVASDIYESISEASLKYYYYNRASTAISSTYGGVYARNLGHPDNLIYVHNSAASPGRPTGSIISSPKGWYDAGDYNKYVVNSGISTYTLLAAYEHYESYYKSKSINIPETGGNLPDILDEIKWNLDWMLTMQDPFDGGVYHKLTGLNFSGIVMPEDYTLNRYVVKKSTAAALNLAAVLAMASRIYSDFDTELPGYSTTLLNAAKAAYTWAESNPTTYFTNPQGVLTGQYGDYNVSDEFQWAAVELFITTNEGQYKNKINLSAIGNGTPSWQYTSPLALISIMFHEPSLSSQLNTNQASNLLMSTANTLKSNVESSVMNISMGNSDYVWGSNGSAANQVLILIRAYEITNDASYLNAAYTAMDYLLGRNGTGYCYVTGYGNKSPLNPHHRISEADAVSKPIPGMLAGGPHSGQQDASGCSVTYPSNYPAASYLDNWCSYASNEVTINWNAPLAYALNALQYYQNKSTLGLDNNHLSNQSIQIFPNPTNDIVKFSYIENINSIKVFDLKGREINKIKLLENNSIDVKNVADGIYLLVFYTSNGVVTKKIIKK
ncbi:glycoside hydrolase family 9 protein [Mariniflexile sp.]|uniref:glycoside hydrolase family 9 protein n=1 Tax=Mariniflexile sp. TaxID=1979402 RepID=UPI0040485C46